jgi:HEAT repeat protein
MAAVRRLGSVSAEVPRARLALLGALGDPAYEVRYEAACVLGPSGDPRAIRTLIEGLWSGSAAHQRAIAGAIQELGPAERDWIEAAADAARNAKAS